ncbi:NAD(P)/FAD-dependent oxidoreductase [Lutimonas vermicola]|uniref:FAD-dependent oxidoreductase n=1 Tax=Lutimonas vermicola TaxID=414288 RepID=A0ABU9L1F9_9FLAO
MKKCIVIGGGIIGLCTAYYLQKEGHQVIVIDQSNMDEGASYVNAGYISPSHIVPLSAPGVVKKGIQWMFDPASPFYVKPRLDNDFLRWAWAFNKSCTKEHVKRSIPVIRDIAVFSHELYEDIEKEAGMDFHFEKKGLLMLCKTQKMLEEEIKIAQLAREVDLQSQVLDKDELRVLEPAVSDDVIGATFYSCDSHTTPHEFMKQMKTHLLAKGVAIKSNEEVLDLEIKEGSITKIMTGQGSYMADEYILAAGSWTGLVAKKLGMRLLLQAGKGYRINVERETKITLPAILVEAKAAVTPMNGFTRFAGTMEINSINNEVNPVRVRAIAKAAHGYYQQVSITEDEMKNASSGLRPLSPDGLPYIGRTKKCSNLTIATGHAMMGWTMATGTGRLVSEIISNKKTSLDLYPFSPDRTF